MTISISHERRSLLPPHRNKTKDEDLLVKKKNQARCFITTGGLGAVGVLFFLLIFNCRYWYIKTSSKDEDFKPMVAAGLFSVDEWLNVPHYPTEEWKSKVHRSNQNSKTKSIINDDDFKDNFIVQIFSEKCIGIGTATSSYQVEGGRWENNDANFRKLREDNWWDSGFYNKSVCGKRGRNSGNSGDVAIDFYTHFKSDLALVKNLGFGYFRLSISWSRVAHMVKQIEQNTTTENITWIVQPNEEGIKFYRNVLKQMKQLGLKPHVTMYHWDLPSVLYPTADFTSPDFVSIFAEYAELLLDRFGRDVDRWTTFNELRSICQGGYDGILAPALTGLQYRCYHYLVLAHAKASIIFRRKYPSRKYPEKWIGITNSGKVQLSPAGGKLGAMASDWWATWEMGVYLEPIFRFDYPAAMKEWLQQEHGIAFTKGEKALLRKGGPPDYFAVQYYNFDLMVNGVYCKDIDQHMIDRMHLPDANIMPYAEMPFDDCVRLCANAASNRSDNKITLNTERIGRYHNNISDLFCVYTDNSKFFWSSANPNHPVELDMGLYNFLQWAQIKYKPRHMLVTENGYPDEDSRSGFHTKDAYQNCGRLADGIGGPCGGCSFSDINDLARLIYFRHHLYQVARAATEIDSIDFRVFYAWSMFDNLEWCDGFRLRFGITCVDYTTSNLTRQVKLSALWFQNINQRIQKNIGSSGCSL